MVRTVSRLLLICVGVILYVFVVQPAWADDDQELARKEIALEKCRSPRRAVESIFAETDAESVMCLGDGRSFTMQVELVRRIREVFSGEDEINLARLSDNQNAQSPVRVHPAHPKVVVAKHADGRWVFTATSLQQVESLYRDKMAETWVGRLPEWSKSSIGDLRLWQIISLALILVVGLVFRKLIEFVVENRVRGLIEKSGQKWASHLIGVFASPGATFISAILLRLSHPQLGLPLWFGAFLELVVEVLLILSVAWAAYRLVDVLSEYMASKASSTDTKLDDQLVPLVRKSLKVFTVIASGLVLLQNLNVNVGALIATLGVGGVAVALAAKDTLANFFGSLMIFIDRPFQIGDWIVVDGCEGTVEEVGFRSTRVRTFYNSVVTIPNSKFTELKIDNMGMRLYRRCYVTLNLSLDTSPSQVQAFVEGIRAIIQANPHTRKDYYEVHMAGFGPSSLQVMLYYFFRVDTWTEELTQRHLVYLEILRLAEGLRVKFAYPTQSLHLDYVRAPGEPRALPEQPSDQELREVVQSFGPDGSAARPAGPELTHGFLAGKTPAKVGGEG